MYRGGRGAAVAGQRLGGTAQSVQHFYAAGTILVAADNGTALLQLAPHKRIPTCPVTAVPHRDLRIEPGVDTGVSHPYNPIGAGDNAALQSQSNWGNISNDDAGYAGQRLQNGGTVKSSPSIPIPANPNGMFGATAAARRDDHDNHAHGLTNANVGKAVTINGVPVAGYDGTFNIRPRIVPRIASPTSPTPAAWPNRAASRRSCSTLPRRGQ